jgi:hypothetical protein
VIRSAHEPVNWKFTTSPFCAVMLLGVNTKPPLPTVTLMTAADAAEAMVSAEAR